MIVQARIDPNIIGDNNFHCLTLLLSPKDKVDIQKCIVLIISLGIHSGDIMNGYIKYASLDDHN